MGLREHIGTLGHEMDAAKYDIVRADRSAACWESLNESPLRSAWRMTSSR